ncbi:MAG: 4Fe-4S dicluster domain-containing protein [Clostridia bacterium]|nr:4Fe-4S dicluster domain-containing protein [Clostridiales bacterium]MBQ2976686.1 4Fe-4S dicluster domain-containing protein [Clostridia bacterium]MDD6681625.1 4Fe-4S dicluster domain-containing protein [Clostridiales bacterium]
MRAFKLVFHPDKCKGCELCKSVCPKGVIGMSDQVNQKGYHPACAKQEENCIGCQSCALMCPDGAIEIYQKEEGDQ